jgi:iron(III) transport system substrate-binding protein
MKKIFALLMSVAFAPASWAQAPDWQKQWDATLAAAKKEGKVVVVGSPDPVMRNDLIPKFIKQYGIQVEYLTGSSSQLAGRIQTERQSGIYSIDVYLSGAGTTVTTLYPNKMLDPLKPLLIHPDVVDGKKWKGGAPTFMDPEEQYIMQLFSTVNDTLFINTDFVKPEELRHVNDLINPRWKGKISSQDPRLGGSGANTAVAFYVGMGPDYIKKLYIDQQPTYSRDRRQMTDWLARGTYPICLTCRADDVKPLIKEGFKLMDVFELDGIMSRVNSAPLLLAYANKAPHPNAAKIFINWFAGRDTLETYSREYEAATLRTDVDESFLDPRMIPKPGVKYPDDTEFDWVLKGRNETAEKVRELLR